MNNYQQKPKKKTPKKGTNPDKMDDIPMSSEKALTIEQDDKCYDSYTPKLDPDDTRAQYDPMAGRSGDRACANCYWFSAGSSNCAVIYGPIVPTGLSKMWMSNEPQDELDPIPVMIVDGSQEFGADPALADSETTAVNIVNQDGKVLGSAVGKKGIKLGDLINAAKRAIGLGKPDTSGLQTGFKVAEVNGQKVWLAWWTNNFEDRTGETFSEKSLDNFVDRVDNGIIPYPELWYRHMPVAAGSAQWVGRVGHLMLAAGKFYDTAVGRKFYDHYKTSGINHTVSHGYLFTTDNKSNSTYHAFNTYEISPLLPGEEANVYTGFGVKEIMSAITDAKRKDLEKIIGVDLAAAHLQAGEERSKQLEEMGVKFKDMGSPDITDDVAREAATILSKNQKALETGIKEQLDTIGESLKSISDQLKTADEQGKARVEADTKRDQRLDNLEKAFEAALGMQPRATQNLSTQVPESDKYLQFLKAKQDEAGVPSGGLFGDVLRRAGFEVAPAEVKP